MCFDPTVISLKKKKEKKKAVSPVLSQSRPRTVRNVVRVRGQWNRLGAHGDKRLIHCTTRPYSCSSRDARSHLHVPKSTCPGTVLNINKTSSLRSAAREWITVTCFGLKCRFGSYHCFFIFLFYFTCRFGCFAIKSLNAGVIFEKHSSPYSLRNVSLSMTANVNVTFSLTVINLLSVCPTPDE